MVKLNWIFLHKPYSTKSTPDHIWILQVNILKYFYK